MSFLSAVKSKVSAALTALGDVTLGQLVGFGDEGSSAPYNVVTFNGVTFMQGQAWSGAPVDPNDPAAGPDPDLKDASTIAQLVAAIGRVLRPMAGVGSTTTQATSGTATVLTHVTSVTDDTIVTYDAGKWTVLHDGYYDISFGVWGDGTVDDTVVRLWLALNDDEVPWTRTVISVPTTACAGITEGGASFVGAMLLSAGQNLKVMHQRGVGTSFDIKRTRFTIALRGSA